MSKYNSERKGRLKKSQQLQIVPQNSRYLGTSRVTSGLGKSILDCAKAMLSTSSSNPKLPEIPTPEREPKLKNFLKSIKEPIPQQIKEYFEGLGNKKEEVGYIERSYITNQNFKQTSYITTAQ
ncbi:hypothetical protein O181_013838 [Austropuccinia psidii MF-1]|uniref:Uncharacterized protein n=1 Tax=Austropuccinia psidii MF-1 TaxID=1389203 RepID=A0A9Q3BZH4_9BASI|nr:hypothetical protein [Austropuccinia psidii MF-1]